MDGTARDNKGLKAPDSGNGGSGRRLRSWKEIAAFFGTDERTVKRWEARGLPVQRVPGGTRTPVYADVGALERWIQGGGRDSRPGPTPAPARRPGSLAVAALALLLAGGAVAVYAIRSGDSPAAAARRQPPPQAAEAYLAGAYHLERRTPDSLERAVQHFGRAIAHDPEYAEAYAGLANCYLLLREYTGMPADEAYPRAAAAAERALQLDPSLSDAHAALGFVTFYWSWDFARARRSFERAIALDPASARPYHWYATALLHMGEPGAALERINQAQRREPQSRSILADKGLILFHAARAGEAVALLNQVAHAEPDFQSPHAYLAVIHLAQGDHAAFLREAREAARLRGDAARLELIASAGRAYGSGDPAAMLRTMLAGQRRLHRRGGESDYALAMSHAMLGERTPALHHLEASIRKRESLAVGLRIEPAFRGLRDDPGFRRLADRIGRRS